MSTVTNRPLGPNDPLYYAPKWALGGETPRRSEKLPPNALPLAADHPQQPEPHAQLRPAEDGGIARLRHSPSLEPAIVPAPPVERRTDYWLKLLARVMLVAVVAQAVAVVAVGIPSMSGFRIPLLDQLMSSLSATKPAAKTAKLEMPRFVGDGGSGAVDEPLPLGVSLSGKADDSYFVLADLSADTALSAGKRINVNTWRLSVGELTKALVIPPRGYSGPMDIVIDLRRTADNAMIGRRVLSMNWTAPPELMTPVAVVAPVAAPTPSAPPPRRIEAEEIAGLLKRGEQMVVTGDLAGARLLLRRAAEAQDARAALALAATYDPLVLGKLGVYGFKSNPDKAREWYEKAKSFGSAEAGKRLEQMAAQAR